MRTAIPRLLACLVLLCSQSYLSAEPPPGDEGLDFRMSIEPLLKQRCLGCHSHAAGRMRGGLTLDSRSGWEQGGGRGPAIIPGKPDESLLIQAVRRTHPEVRMPPSEPLPSEELDLLVRWVTEGAHDPRESVAGAAEGISTDWWSLRPLRRPAVPVPAMGDLTEGVTHPVDAFLRHRRPVGRQSDSPLADRRTLIRRLMFDLHGLPPTYEETAEFLADSDPLAYERLVERLLASPRYGERWARHWLDTIHFADSHGFEHDVFRPHAWRFRDYVIDRLNQDVDWPRFVREQLAADVFCRESPADLVALGFLGAGTYDHSAAVTAPMSFEHLDRDDLVNQVAGSFLSTTVGCARCHDHKFDPIPQADYYALQAVFAGIGKGNIAFDADPQIAGRRKKWEQLRSAADFPPAPGLLTAENQALVAQFEDRLRTTARWRQARIVSFTSAAGAELRVLDDGSILSGGTAPATDSLTLVVEGEQTITALRLDLLTDESLPGRGPGRAVNGNLHLTEVEMQLRRSGAAAAQRVQIVRATSDFDQAGWTIQQAIDGNPATGWGIDPQEGQPHSAVFEPEAPLILGPGDTLGVVLKQEHGRSHLIGRCRLTVTDGPPGEAIVLPTALTDLLAIPAAERTEEQRLQVVTVLLKRLAESELARLPTKEQVYAAAATAENERGVVRFEQPREIRILKRGDLAQPGEVVVPGSLSAILELPGRFELPPGASESVRRAALADWLVDRRNPLTWRSLANRIWHSHFGRGICDTPGDFGRMGGVPSHPELLDWLACELRDGGGTLKSLHQLICTSRAYRQSSAGRADLAAEDPENRLLGRMNRVRLDAECFHDAVLRASGGLDGGMHGPGEKRFSSRPGPQLTPVLDCNDYDWSAPGAGRRAIYRVVWRGIPEPLFEALDFPDLGLLAPTRGFSASPLQALTLMNNRFVLHQVVRLADRARGRTEAPAERIRCMVRWCWLRDPTAEEAAALGNLGDTHGLEAVARLLFNSNEFLFVD